MTPFLSTYSAHSVEELVKKIESHPGFRPALGIIFCSVALGIPHLAAQLISKGLPVFGSSTAGEILVREDDPPMQEQSCVCCLMDLDPSLFGVRLFQRGSGSTADLGALIGEWGSSIFTKSAFIIALSGLKNDAESAIHGIISASPVDIPCYGGSLLTGVEPASTLYAEEDVLLSGTNGRIATIARTSDGSTFTRSNVQFSNEYVIGTIDATARSEGFFSDVPGPIYTESVLKEWNSGTFDDFRVRAANQYGHETKTNPGKDWKAIAESTGKYNVKSI